MGKCGREKGRGEVRKVFDEMPVKRLDEIEECGFSDWWWGWGRGSSSEKGEI